MRRRNLKINRIKRIIKKEKRDEIKKIDSDRDKNNEVCDQMIKAGALELSNKNFRLGFTNNSIKKNTTHQQPSQ